MNQRAIFSFLAVGCLSAPFLMGAADKVGDNLPSLQKTAASPEVQKLRDERLWNFSAEQIPVSGRNDRDWMEAALAWLSGMLSLESNVEPESLESVVAALEKLTYGRETWSSIKCYGTPDDCRRYLAGEFIRNSQGVPVLLLLAMAKKESDFHSFTTNGSIFHNRPDKNNKSDWGIMQVRDWQRKGCRMDTVGDQIACGAGFFKKLLDLEKGDYKRAMSRYACGRPESTTARTKNFVVPFGLIVWQALENGLPRENVEEILEVCRKRASSGASLSLWGPYLALYERI